MGKLTAIKVKSIKEPGRYGDGDGLMFVHKPSGAQSWIVRVQFAGRRRDAGLGAYVRRNARLGETNDPRSRAIHQEPEEAGIPRYHQRISRGTAAR